MIISQTPFRISLVGGGTDLPAFYRETPGAVVSTAINKYMYITVNRYFDDHIILKYSKTELVRKISHIRHPLLRECLKKTELTKSIEITSMADIVGGTGLGSSSSFTVGLLHSLHAYKGEFVSAEQLAQEACGIEMGRLKEPIGKQDQYIAAYGGCQFIEFMPDESVRINPLICPPSTLEKLQNRLLLLFTGVTRKSRHILKSVHSDFPHKARTLRSIRALADVARVELQAGRVETIGEILHEGWLLKKSLAGGISNKRIDQAYDLARKHGAKGGKILGAGGGGFLLLYVEPERRAAIVQALAGWREIFCAFEPEGSKIIYVSK